MNKAFLVLAVLMVIFAGIFHIMFIMFDYAFHNDDSGAFSQLSDRLNETMNPTWQNLSYNNSKRLTQFFGLGRIICIGLAPAMFIIAVVSNKRQIE